MKRSKKLKTKQTEKEKETTISSYFDELAKQTPIIEASIKAAHTLAGEIALNPKTPSQNRKVRNKVMSDFMEMCKIYTNPPSKNIHVESRFAYRNKHNNMWLDIAYSDTAYEVECVADASLYRAKNLLEQEFYNVKTYIQDDDNNIHGKREDYELIELKVTYDLCI